MSISLKHDVTIKTNVMATGFNLIWWSFNAQNCAC